MVEMRKTSRKPPPPFAAVMYGNFQTAPSPMAEPADARIKPSFEPHCDFSDIVETPILFFKIRKGYLSCQIAFSQWLFMSFLFD